MSFENKRDAEDYSVLYTELKARATNFLSSFAVTLAWARLITERTALDTPERVVREWSLADYV